MRPKQKGIHPRCKLWISCDDAEGVFGDGRWRLLRAIMKEGSLKAATQSLKISYRKAWGDLQKTEKHLGKRFVEKHRGGAGGGEAILAPAGEAWFKAYTQFRLDVEDVIAKSFAANIAPLLPKGEP